MNSMVEIAKKVYKMNLNLRENETILVVCDTNLLDIANIFYEAGNDLGHETLLFQMEPREKSGQEPPHIISEAMKLSDIVLCITQHSLTHTNARKEASAAGARIATMPGVTKDMLEEGAISADYEEVESLTKKYCDILDAGNNVEIKKSSLTLTFSIKERSSVSSTGIFREQGHSGNLPSGESYIAPIEDSANGSLIVDGSIAGLGVLTEPVTLTIENGRLIDATGKDGSRLLALLGDGDGRTIAEFGIGTNPKARLSGNVLEDEKVYGTVHIAFGSNKPFGGVTEAGVHIDCVVKEPEVFVDGECVSV